MAFNNIMNNVLQVHQLTLLVFLLSIVVGLSGCGDIWELAKTKLMLEDLTIRVSIL